MLIANLHLLMLPLLDEDRYRGLLSALSLLDLNILEASMFYVSDAVTILDAKVLWFDFFLLERSMGFGDLIFPCDLYDLSRSLVCYSGLGSFYGESSRPEFFL